MLRLVTFVSSLCVGCGRLGFDTAAGDAQPVRGFGFQNFADCALLQLLDDATCMNGVLEVTPQVTTRRGAAWYRDAFLIDEGTHVEIRAEVEIDVPLGVSSGDGMAFVLQADPRTISAIGDTGGGLGYSAIMPSIAVELDTNTNPDYGDLDGNHVGVDVDGSLRSLIVGNAPFAMSDGEPFTVWIDYQPNTTPPLAVFLARDGTKPPLPILEYGTGQAAPFGAVVQFGITAATGANWESHHVRSWTVELSP